MSTEFLQELSALNKDKTKIHQESIIIDGLMINGWDAGIFEAMHKAGLTAVNCTCSVWEDFPATMKAVADWKQWFNEFSDIMTQVYTVDDIRRAKKENKVGVILGWQNSSGFGDYLPNVQLFKELGVGIVQLTYNTANSVGSGCYESTDGGLTDFGKELIDEMNRVGILIDLSHVGPKTSRDAIGASKAPVAYTHCAPAAFAQHPRNKEDAELKFIAEHGGVVGVTMFPPFLPNRENSTLDDYIDSIEYLVNLIGEDQVAVGTDFALNRCEADRYHTAHDKGHARKLVEYGNLTMPRGFQTVDDFPNLTARLDQRGWTEDRMRKVIGENWLRLLGEVWGNDHDRSTV